MHVPSRSGASGGSGSVGGAFGVTDVITVPKLPPLPAAPQPFGETFIDGAPVAPVAVSHPPSGGIGATEG